LPAHAVVDSLLSLSGLVETFERSPSAGRRL
jgi:hypothetical protein